MGFVGFRGPSAILVGTSIDASTSLAFGSLFDVDSF